MATIRIRRKRRPDDPIELMEDIQVNEVSLVDQPATGEPFVLFKSASGKASFPGQGETPGQPNLRPPRETPEQRGNRTPTMDEALGGLERILEATLEGDDSTVDDMGKKVPEGRDRETFERCIEKVEGETGDKGRAYAICTAGGAGEGKAAKAVDAHTHEVTLPDGATLMTGPPVAEETSGGSTENQEGGMAPYPPPEPGKRKESKMRQKQDPPLPEDVAAEEMPPPEGAGVLEIPATPSEWSMSACIDQAAGLGLSEDQAVQVCQLVRQEYGDPSDEASILVPQGESQEGLIGGAAVQLGFATLGGGGAKTLKRFTGRNRWSDKFKQFLGLNPNRPSQVDNHDVVRLAKALKGVSDLMFKTKEDLRAYIEGQQRENLRLHEDNQRLLGLLARGMGIDVPEPAPAPPTPLRAPEAAPSAAPVSMVASAAGGAPPAPAVALGPPAVVLEAAAAAGGKRVKEGGVAIEERLAVIEEALAAILAGGMLGGSPPAMPGGPEDMAQGPSTVALDAPLKRLLRSSVPAVTQVKSATGEDLVWSSPLNMYIPRADREAASIGGGGPLSRRR